MLNSVGRATPREAVRISGNRDLSESVSTIIVSDLLRITEHVHMNSTLHNKLTVDNVIGRTVGLKMNPQTVHEAIINNG